MRGKPPTSFIVMEFQRMKEKSIYSPIPPTAPPLFCFQSAQKKHTEQRKVNLFPNPLPSHLLSSFFHSAQKKQTETISDSTNSITNKQIRQCHNTNKDTKTQKEMHTCRRTHCILVIKRKRRN